MRIVVLVSGNGTNLQAVIDACASKLLPASVVHVFSNREGVLALKRARAAHIPTTCLLWEKKKENREAYDKRLAILIQKQQPTLIVLAGWMHLLSKAFLCQFNGNQIINLHPALPGTFAGAHAIQDAFGTYGLTESGVMVHTVVEEMDAGQTIAQLTVPRFQSDTLHIFEARIHAAEKIVLVNAIGLQLNRIASTTAKGFKIPILLKRGKVRDMYDFNYSRLLMHATDRCSCFDQYVCDIPQKGNVINRISAWWLNETRHIVPNHLVYVVPDFSAMVVKKCQVFPIEFVVRGYITGTTNTAMWTLYSSGVRKFGDILVEDGLKKNQKLNAPIVTPTTKSDDHDEPIDRQHIIEHGIMSEEQYDYCHTIAIRLFQFGQTVSAQRGLILVDTKYEFGIDPITDEIILVDEVHTCDSSRYWRAGTYQLLFDNNLEPERFDKDMIRLYIKERCDPYCPDTILPPIPQELINQVSTVYLNFYHQLTGTNQLEHTFPVNDITLSAIQTTYLIDVHTPHVVVMYNCQHDNYSYAMRLSSLLKFKYGILSTMVKQDPHKNTNDLLQYIEQQQKRKDVIYVVVDKNKLTRKSTAAVITRHSNAVVIEASNKKLIDTGDVIQRICFK
jgi:phosphoribosylaminoimidazole-succinocarboxamide synthase